MRDFIYTKQRRYARLRGRLPAMLLALAVGVGLWPLAGMWYTSARQGELTLQPTQVATVNAQELTVSAEQQAAYRVLSAARALDRQGNTSGYVVITAVQGYKSVIRVQSTFSADGGRLAGIRVLSQNETEYLGERVATEGFTSLFAGRQPPMKLWGSATQGSPIDGLSGSTISAQAVVQAVNNAYGFLQAYL